MNKSLLKNLLKENKILTKDTPYVVGDHMVLVNPKLKEENPNANENGLVLGYDLEDRNQPYYAKLFVQGIPGANPESKIISR